MTQRKMKAQPPLSDAYLHGMPAKRRKVIKSGAAFCHHVRIWPLSLFFMLHVCVCDFRQDRAVRPSSPSLMQ